MIQSLQAYRGVAALVVLVFHLLGSLAWPGNYNFTALAPAGALGRVAVEFFFVLSGFIICHAHWRDLGRPERVGRYLMKRAIRLYPAYLTVLSAACAWAVLRHQHLELRGDFGMMLKTLALVPQDPAIVGGKGAPVLGVAWTLQYEIFFYLCFAVAVCNRWLGILLIIAVISGNMLAGGAAFPWSFCFADDVLLFLFGVGVFVLARCSLAEWIAWIFLLGGCAIAGGIIVGDYVWQVPALEVVKLAGGIAASLVILGLISLERQGRTFGAGRFMGLLGAASYAIYLIHFPLINMVIRGVSGIMGWSMVSGVVAALASIAASILCGILFHLHVEQPVISWLQRRLLNGSPGKIHALPATTVFEAQLQQ